MPSLLSSLGLDHLSVTERIQLAQELWDSIAPSAEQLPLTEAQRQELDRRLAVLQANPDNVIPWEEVEARALARFQSLFEKTDLSIRVRERETINQSSQTDFQN